MHMARDARHERPRRRCLGTSGATAIEYALIASLIMVAIIAGVTVTSGRVTNLFNIVGNAFS